MAKAKQTTKTELDTALEAINADAVLTEIASEEAGAETSVEDVLEAVDDTVVEEIIEEGSTEVSAMDGALADDLLRDLDIGLEVIEGYEATEAGDTVDPDAAKAAKKADKPAKAAKAPKEKKEGAVRTPRDVSTVAPEFFALTEPAADADLEAIKSATMALKPTQKKIAEKFDNLFTSLSVNKAPSTYVMIAFGLLDEKKSVTSTDIVAAYKAADLGEGTARSQSGQIMNLFATVGIATRAGQVLTLNADSKIAQRIRSLPAKA
jgi:hypothetical protein